MNIPELSWPREADSHRAWSAPAILAALLAVLLPSAAFGQISPETTTTSTGQVSVVNGNVTYTFQHTTITGGANSNSTLIVGVSLDTSSRTSTDVTAVAYGGVALSQATQRLQNNNVRMELWYLVNPPAGTAQNVVLTLNANGTGTVGIVAGAVTYTGVTGTPQNAANAGQSNNAGPATATINNVPTGDVVVDVLATPGAVSVTSGASQTPAWNLNSGTTANDVRGVSSYRTNTGAVQNITMTENLSASADWAIGVVRLQRATVNTSITKADLPDPASVGQTLTYTLTVGNAGPLTANNVTVTDSLPVEVSYLSATPSQGTCSFSAPTLTCNLGQIASGVTNVTVAIQTTVSSAGSGTITNTASVTQNEFDTNTANNSATATTTVSADVSVVKTGPAVPVYLGDTFSYALAVSNGGPSTATNVTVTDALPAGLRFLSVSASQGSCSGTTTVTCSLGPLANGANATIKLTVQARATGSISNTASVTATEADPNPGNNSSTATLTVQQINTADVSITKTGAPGSVAVGGNVTYAVTVRNNGPNAANGVTVTDPTPPGMTWMSTNVVNALGTTGGCVGTAVVSCAFNTPNGGTSVITIVARVDAVSTKNNTATAAVDTTTTYDPDPTNNSATAVTTVTGGSAPFCSTPATIGPGGTLAGVINTYYPGTASVVAGATSITLGPARGAPAAQVPIAAGDLVLVIQMQDADINSTNTANYGGNNGTGAGALTVSAGRYEFVRALNAVPLAGGTLTLQGGGGGAGLINAYTNANASATKGQLRFQVVRVPQYTTATLAGVTAASWLTDRSGGALNGLGTGGIAAVDIQGDLTLGSGVAAAVDGQGFRGAAGRQLGGSGSPCGGMTLASTDWRTSSTCNTNGGKGEGNAGTPMWIFDPAGAHACGGGIGAPPDYYVNTNQANDGYPNGSMARGAPGSAGGGSTDDNPPANDRNSGGGGGSNGGAGGTGGFSWFTGLDRGGRGAAVTPAITQLVLGGGGGAGTRNNDNCGSNGATAAQEGQASSGASGGGLLVVRAGSFTVGSGASLSANGSDAYDDTLNDGGGGGGAGGSVILTINTGSMSGLTVTAVGGRGGSAWKNFPPGAAGQVTGNNHHGPGGGGGGGVIVYTNTAVPPALDVSGGASGISTTDNSPFGAQAGGLGQTLFASQLQIPGVGSAAACAFDPAIALTHSPATVASGATVGFVATVTNVAPLIATSGQVSVTITLDPGLQFSGLASGTGWTCQAPVGQSVTCARSDALVAQQSYPPISFNALVIAAGPATLSNNTATVSNASDPNPTNNTATDVVGVLAPTLARLRSFHALRSGDVVRLVWQTSFESDNLGFNVYRETGGARQLLTPSLVAGSALFVGKQTMTSGRSYSWIDHEPGADPIYWLEDVAVNGVRSWNGPAIPRLRGGASASGTDGPVVDSPLLRDLGKGKARGRRRGPGPGLGFERRHRREENRAPRVQPWTLPSKPAAKLLVEQEGWYRVTKADLLAAGFDPGSDPRNLQLVAGGEEQPILVRDGGDGRFDLSDSIEFYGLAFDSPYDADHVYWLVAGDQPGARIWTSPFRGRSLPAAPTSFPFTVQRKDRTVFFTALTNNGDAENFFGVVITSEPVALELQLPNPDLVAPGTSPLTVALQGVTSDVPHYVDVQLNGHDAGALEFSGQDHPVQELSVPNAWLQAGANQVSLVARGGDDDISVVDYVEVTYPHLYQVDSGALRMAAPPGTMVTIPGLADPSLRVVDVTDPDQVRELPVRFDSQGSGVAASFAVRGREAATLYAFTPERVLSPVAIVPNTPSQLRSERNQADFVVIAHPSLLASVKPLQALRRSQGLATEVVDVTDVYDEFAYGQKTPFAIRDFLWQARKTWRKPPRYVLLVGDASFDPKNYLGFGDFDLVPTKLIPTTYLKTDSDDWFVDFDGDGIPEMAVGRLPARTPAEASLIVSKMQTREAAFPAMGANRPDWTRRVLLVADRNDDFDFEAAAERLRRLLPPGISAQEVFVGELGPASRGAIVSSIDAGQLLVNYTGHGSEDVWSREAVFTGDDARALTNGPRLPIVVAMNCLNGLFDDLYVESLAEALVEAPNGGAVAVWASSALTEPVPQAQMNEELFRIIFRGSAPRLGDAVVKAKTAVTDENVRKTWILFGDPTMRVR